MIPALEDCGVLDVGDEGTVFETLWSEDNSPYTCLFLTAKEELSSFLR